MSDVAEDGRRYECVEPPLGEQLWQYDLPEVDPVLRRDLEQHLKVCDACRMARAVEHKVAAGLKDGWLVLDEQRRRTPLAWLAALFGVYPRLLWVRGAAVTGSLLLLTSLLLVVLLPPPDPDLGLVRRTGADELRFTRPVEGEVVLGGHPRFTWEAIEGATAYRLAVREVGGGYEWTGETRSTQTVVPDDAPVPLARRMRAYLEPIPSDLVPPGGITVSFRCDRLGSFMGYRVSAADPLMQLLGILGLVLLAAAGVVATLRPRRAAIR